MIEMLTCDCSVVVVVDCGMHKDRTPPNCEACDWYNWEPIVKRPLAGVLWWQVGEVYRKAGTKVSNMVNCGLFGGKDDDGWPLSFGNDITRGRQAHEAPYKKICFMDLLDVLLVIFEPYTIYSFHFKYLSNHLYLGYVKFWKHRRTLKLNFL